MSTEIAQSASWSSSSSLMAQNYYQAQQPPYPQYYKPQNIYQQLGQPEPVPRQQVYPQPSVYQPPPPQPYYPHRAPPSPLYSQWANPQVQSVPYLPPSIYTPAHPQRRPLPLPAKRSNSSGPAPSSAIPLQRALSSNPFPSSPIHPQPQPPSQPSSQSPSPTRSRPLPTPTPGPPKPRPASSFIPQQQVTPPTTLRRTPSPVKSTNPLTNAVHANPDSPIKRGRASPPHFSIPSSASSTYNPPSLSPSPRSTESSLTPDRDLSPDTNLIGKSGASKPIVTAPAENVGNNTAPSAPPSTSGSAGSSTSAQPKKFVPIWKRTIPDVLPPLYPPHILAQRGPPVAQPQPPLQPQTQPRPAPVSARAVSAAQPPPQPQTQPRSAPVPARAVPAAQPPHQPQTQLRPAPVSARAVPAAQPPPQHQAQLRSAPVSARAVPAAQPPPQPQTQPRSAPVPARAVPAAQPPPQHQAQPRPAPAPARTVPTAQPQSQFSRPTNANTAAPVVNGYNNYNYNPNGNNATNYAPPQNGPAQPSVNAYARRQEEEVVSSEEEDEGDEEEESEEEEKNVVDQYRHHHRWHQRHGHPDDDDDDGEPSDSDTESDLTDEDPQMSTSTQDHRGRGGRQVEPERSPQYGIRDLPRRMDVGPLPQPPVMVRNGQRQSAPAPSRPQSSWDGSRDVRGGSESGGNDRSSSRTMRLAAGSSGGGGGEAGPWPQGLPRLPRTPADNSSAGRRADLNLDDTPPPASPSFAMRRTPSPSPVLEQDTPKKRELPQPQTSSQMRVLGRERPQSQIYGASTSSSRGQGQGQVDRPRPQSQIHAPPGPVKQQHGGPRAPSQMQHHHQRREFERGHDEEDYHVPVVSRSVSDSQDDQTRRQALPQRHSIQQHQPQSRDRPQSPYQPQHQHQHQPHHQSHHPQSRHKPQPQYPSQPHYQPQPQPRYQPPHQNEGSQTQPLIKIESPSPVGGRDRLADIPRIELEGAAAGLPSISVMDDSDYGGVPTITVQSDDDDNVPRGGGGGVGEANEPQINVFEVPGISIAGPEESDVPAISVPGNEGRRQSKKARAQIDPQQRRGGLICGGCDGPIVGRIVNAMGARWHPDCFRCTVCDALLEHVSSYEHEGRAYCHLDYHENFAPRCYSCKTSIIEERFISLDDPALGKRTYHEQHFFCAECGDPFLSPSSSSNLSSRTGELNVNGDGDFEADDVGFTVYRGHPYCEACHVRLRLPKCKRCKRSIRDGDEAVEALGGKWCWGCFVCASCQKPFGNPSFFQRGDQPYCEPCFSIILRNEV